MPLPQFLKEKNMAKPTTITFKFKRPIAISLPLTGMRSPNLYPTTRTVNGFSSPVPVQDYDFDEEYDVTLLAETPDALPDHLQSLDPEIKKAFQTQQATALAENHKLNNVTRNALKKYEEEGIIEITHDSFENGPKEGSEKEASGDWKLQDANALKRLDEDSLDARNDREDRQTDPNPHTPRQIVGSDANYQATAERNAEFGDHEGVPTTEEPKPKDRKEPKKKELKSTTSTEVQAGEVADATKTGSGVVVNSEGTEATPNEKTS
jgi:hypothetical protein